MTDHPDDRRTTCHTCTPDGDLAWLECLGGEIYGPCEDPYCGGTCERQGPCDCTCHDEEPTP